MWIVLLNLCNINIALEACEIPSEYGIAKYYFLNILIIFIKYSILTYNSWVENDIGIQLKSLISIDSLYNLYLF